MSDRRPPSELKRSGWSNAVALFLLAGFTVGSCGGDDGISSPESTIAPVGDAQTEVTPPDAPTTAVVTTIDESSDTESPATSPADPDTEAILAETEWCRQLVTIETDYEDFTPFDADTSTFERLLVTLSTLADSAPAEIGEDFAVFAQAYADFFEARQQLGGAAVGSDSAAAEIFNQPRLREAGENIEAYLSLCRSED